MNIDEEVILEIERRRELADYYYDNFRKYYENKNYSKASEFLWRSLNALTYAIGLFYEEKVSDHGKVVSFIKRFVDTYKDKEMVGGLASAQRIYANFLYDFMDETMFEGDRKRTEKMLEKLVKIIDTKLKKRRNSSFLQKLP